MKIKKHTINSTNIAEVISDHIIVKTIDDALDLLGNLYYQDFSKIIVHQNNITPDFFDLKSGIAGEILQKFSNYRVQLFIVGDTNKFLSKSLNAFIYESNKGKQLNFVSSTEEALKRPS